MPSSPSFAVLGVPTSLVDVLAGLDITDPTPIQAATLPDALAGRDVLGRGRTGSGKTFAFLLPVVARLAGGSRARSTAPRALVLAPTRELVGQIEASLAPLARATGLSTATVIGGVGQQPQVTALRRGVDVLVATPGRLEDLIAQKHCSLADVQVTVLDEADHMADLGFLPAVRRLLALTPERSQRLLFSATLDNAVDQLVRRYLHDPAVHEADSAAAPSARLMAHHVLHVAREHRLDVLVDLASAPGRTVVFTRTKHGAKALTRQLNKRGVPAVELHGNLGQNARTRNLDAFHDGRVQTLVATDIAARGIHVDDVGLVVHADPPAEHKAYLHRSGRTARAGSSGTVVTLATPEQLRDVQSLTRAAGIRPTITRLSDPHHPVLRELAPGERVVSATPVEEPAGAPAQPATPSGRAGTGSGGSGRPRRRRGRVGGQATGQPGNQRGTAASGQQPAPKTGQKSSQGQKAAQGQKAGRTSGQTSGQQGRTGSARGSQGRRQGAGGGTGGGAAAPAGRGHSAASFSARAR